MGEDGAPSTCGIPGGLIKSHPGAGLVFRKYAVLVQGRSEQVEERFLDVVLAAQTYYWHGVPRVAVKYLDRLLIDFAFVVIGEFADDHVIVGAVLEAQFIDQAIVRLRHQAVKRESLEGVKSGGRVLKFDAPIGTEPVLQERIRIAGRVAANGCCLLRAGHAAAEIDRFARPAK